MRRATLWKWRARRRATPPPPSRSPSRFARGGCWRNTKGNERDATRWRPPTGPKRRAETRDAQALARGVAQTDRRASRDRRASTSAETRRVARVASRSARASPSRARARRSARATIVSKTRDASRGVRAWIAATRCATHLRTAHARVCQDEGASPEFDTRGMASVETRRRRFSTRDGGDVARRRERGCAPSSRRGSRVCAGADTRPS